MSESASSSLDIIRAHADASPLAAWLNFSVDADNDGALYRLGFDERHIGNPAIRALHGGVIGMFLEFAMQCELKALADDARVSTVNISVDYLRSSKPEDMTARAALVRRGRRVSILEARGWQGEEEHPVAIARATLRINP